MLYKNYLLPTYINKIIKIRNNTSVNVKTEFHNNKTNFKMKLTIFL